MRMQQVTEAFVTLCIYRRYQQAASSLCLEDVTRQDRREWDCEEPPTQCPHSPLPLFVALHQGVCHPCGQEPLRQGLVGMEERPPSQPMEAWQEVDDESARFMLSRRQGRELVVAPTWAGEWPCWPAGRELPTSSATSHCLWETLHRPGPAPLGVPRGRGAGGLVPLHRTGKVPGSHPV